MAPPQNPIYAGEEGLSSAQPNMHIMDTTTGKGILIGLLSAFGSAGIVALILIIIYFFQFTQRGRILLDRLSRPGEYDDEQAFLRDEAEALENMDDMQRIEYLRAKGMEWMDC
jgi:hypothetical protein